MLKRCTYIGYIFLVLSLRSSVAQQELGLHFIDNVWQSNYTNPAIFPDTSGKFLVSIFTPYFSFSNTGFTFSDVIREDDQSDSTIIDGDYVLSVLDKKNYFFTDFNIQLFNVKFVIDSVYQFSVSMEEKTNFSFMYPKKLIDVLWNGNAGYLGQEVELGIALNATFYSELTVGVARNFGKWNVGIRLKYLNGISNMSSKRNSATLYTSSAIDSASVTTDYLINTSGVTLDEFLEPVEFLFKFQPFSYLFSGAIFENIANPKNSGFGADIGATYKLNDKFTFSASIVDLGFIKWKSEVKNYTSKNTFSFTGIDVNQFFATDTFSFQNYLDTLEDRFKFDETENSYTTYLITKTYLSGKYHINPKSSINLLLYAEFFDGIQPGVSAGYTRRFTDQFRASFFYSYKNKSFFNIGMGWSLTLGKVQLFAVGDNLSTLFFPRKSKNYNLRAGMNLRF